MEAARRLQAGESAFLEDVGRLIEEGCADMERAMNQLRARRAEVEELAQRLAAEREDLAAERAQLEAGQAELRAEREEAARLQAELQESLLGERQEVERLRAELHDLQLEKSLQELAGPGAVDGERPLKRKAMVLDSMVASGADEAAQSALDQKLQLLVSGSEILEQAMDLDASAVAAPSAEEALQSALDMMPQLVRGKEILEQAPLDAAVELLTLDGKLELLAAEACKIADSNGGLRAEGSRREEELRKKDDRIAELERQLRERTLEAEKLRGSTDGQPRLPSRVARARGGA